MGAGRDCVDCWWWEGVQTPIEAIGRVSMPEVAEAIAPETVSPEPGNSAVVVPAATKTSIRDNNSPAPCPTVPCIRIDSSGHTQSFIPAGTLLIGSDDANELREYGGDTAPVEISARTIDFRCVTSP